MDLKYWLPHASKSFLAANSDSLPSDTEPKQAFCDESLATNPGKTGNPGRCHISIVSYRRRLLDPDNLCPKYAIDALRYAKIIPDDTEKDITYTITQKKVEKKNQEKTLIIIDL